MWDENGEGSHRSSTVESFIQPSTYDAESGRLCALCVGFPKVRCKTTRRHTCRRQKATLLEDKTHPPKQTQTKTTARTRARATPTATRLNNNSLIPAVASVAPQASVISANNKNENVKPSPLPIRSKFQPDVSCRLNRSKSQLTYL